jgi:hypothetical protein
VQFTVPDCSKYNGYVLVGQAQTITLPDVADDVPALIKLKLKITCIAQLDRTKSTSYPVVRIFPLDKEMTLEVHYEDVELLSTQVLDAMDKEGSDFD